MAYHSKRHIRQFIWVPVALFLVAVIAWVLVNYVFHPYRDNDVTFGVTFSTKYSEELGLDWREAFIATLDELQVRHYRIPVYWDEIETEQGQIDLSNIEWMLDEADARGASVILAIGERVPRWPECHPPAWAEELWLADRQTAELQMLEEVVFALRDKPAIATWQVQNEAFFATFGECPSPDRDHIRNSVHLVREMDPTRPIMMTDSGELSTWTSAADLTDILGISMYRVTWNELLGYFFYPLPPRFYSLRAKLIAPLVDDVIVSELQVEPWPPGTAIEDTPLEIQYESMDIDRFHSHINYAQRTGFSQVYLWGVEWWYWMRQEFEEPAFWDEGAQLFKQQNTLEGDTEAMIQ